MMIPRINVIANPRIWSVPIAYSKIAVISVVRFASIIVIVAREKPLRIAAFTRAPSANSSRIRSKISTFASTAIPTVRTRPAIPERVKDAPIMTITAKINTRFNSKANAATNPGTPKYQTIMNNSTITIDQMIAWVPFAMVAVPNDAPILFSLSGTGFSVPGKEPALKIPIIWSTRDWVKSPSITPLSEIRLLIFAEDNKLPSRTIESCLSIFSPVNRPNVPALVAFIVNATLGRMLPS